jgi:hypothetical protein
MPRRDSITRVATPFSTTTRSVLVLVKRRHCSWTIVLPQQPVRQWMLSLPFALRYLLATRPEVVTQVLGIVNRAISGHLIRKARLTRASAVTGSVTLIQRFGSALNLNVHFLVRPGDLGVGR